MSLKENIKHNIRKEFDITLRDDILDFITESMLRLCKKYLDICVYIFDRTNSKVMHLSHAGIALFMVLSSDYVSYVMSYRTNALNNCHREMRNGLNKSEALCYSELELDYKLFLPMISRALRSAHPGENIKSAIEVSVTVECMVRFIINELIYTCVEQRSNSFSLEDLKDVISHNESLRMVFYEDIWGPVQPLTIPRRHLGKCLLTNRLIDCFLKKCIHNGFKIAEDAYETFDECVVAYLDRVVRAVVEYNPDRDTITLQECIDALHKQNICIESVDSDYEIEEHLESFKESEWSCVSHDVAESHINKILKLYTNASLDDESMWLMHRLYQTYLYKLINTTRMFMYNFDENFEFVQKEQIETIARYMMRGDEARTGGNGRRRTAGRASLRMGGKPVGLTHPPRTR